MKKYKRRKPGEKRISIASAKQRARSLQQWVAEKISNVTGIPWGKDQLIESREMGQSGVDVKLIGKALKNYPFSIECKNQEKWDIPGFIKQAKNNLKPNTDWQLFVKKNYHDPIVIMDANAWFEIWRELFILKDKK